MASFVVVKNDMKSPYQFSMFHEDKEETIKEACRLNRKGGVPFVVMKVIGVAKNEEYFSKENPQ